MKVNIPVITPEKKERYIIEKNVLKWWRLTMFFTDTSDKH